MDKVWEEMHNNPPENWREVWGGRRKLMRFDTQKSALSYIKKNQDYYESELAVDIHPKDGYVVYAGGMENMNKQTLDALTTKFDSLYCDLEERSELDLEKLKSDVNELVNFLESIGGVVNRVQYKD